MSDACIFFIMHCGHMAVVTYNTHPRTSSLSSSRTFLFLFVFIEVRGLDFFTMSRNEVFCKAFDTWSSSLLLSVSERSKFIIANLPLLVFVVVVVVAVVVVVVVLSASLSWSFLCLTQLFRKPYYFVNLVRIILSFHSPLTVPQRDFVQLLVANEDPYNYYQNLTSTRRLDQNEICFFSFFCNTNSLLP